jgi:prophage DNA circulation protein
MSSEPTSAETSVVVEIHPPSTSSENTALVSSQTDAIVTVELTEDDDEIKRETQALIAALRKRAQAEVQSAGNLSRDAYLSAIRQARATVEQSHLMIDPQRLEQTIQDLQREADKSWHVILGEIESVGFQLADAARLAWNNLMATHPK